jgi:hypothetical protein
MAALDIARRRARRTWNIPMTFSIASMRARGIQASAFLRAFAMVKLWFLGGAIHARQALPFAVVATRQHFPTLVFALIVRAMNVDVAC